MMIDLRKVPVPGRVCEGGKPGTGLVEIPPCGDVLARTISSRDMRKKTLPQERVYITLREMKSTGFSRIWASHFLALLTGRKAILPSQRILRDHGNRARVDFTSSQLVGSLDL